MNKRTLINSALFTIAAVVVIAWKFSNEANTEAEISTIISGGIEKLEICPIKENHIVVKCTTYSSAKTLSKFEIALKGGQPVSGREHLGTTLESALKVSSKGAEYWYVATVHEGIPEKLYLSKIELISPSKFRHTSNRYVLPDSFRYIFN